MIYLRIACLLCFLAVLMGAFGAHILRPYRSDYLMGVYHTGFLYHFFHSIVLLILSLFAFLYSIDFKRPFYLFFIGIILFSGSLYLLCITHYSFFGFITPFGGLLFLLSWCDLFFKVSKLSKLSS